MDSNQYISRRDLLKSTCGFVGAAALVSLGGSLNVAMAHGTMPRKKDEGVPRVGDVLVFAEDKRKGEVVSLADLVIDGSPLLVQAKDPSSGTVRESDNSTVLLFRTSPDKVPPDLQESSVQGVLAYSALCTHLGCVLKEWEADKKLFVCPCHEARFDPMQSGKCVVGPGPRSLPILPLKLEDNKLVVADEFSAHVGPERS